VEHRRYAVEQRPLSYDTVLLAVRIREIRSRDPRAQISKWVESPQTILNLEIRMAVSKTQLEDYVSDLFSDFLYYSRKEDEDFTMADAENLPSVVTKDELTAMFQKQIDEIYN